MKRKLFTFGIVILTILQASVLLVTGFYLKTSLKRKESNTLYVGRDGISNYNNIQEALDNAFYGYTISFYDESFLYYKNIVINETIKLIGEDKYTTTID